MVGLGLSAAVAAAKAEQPFIRVTQLGFNPSDAKIGLAFSQEALPVRFDVVAADTQATAFEGPSIPVDEVRWGQFEHHAELDFSALKTPGRYFLRVGGARSWPFTISTRPYRSLPSDLLEFMRQQRCGYNPWLDAVCHPFDGRTAYGPLTNGTYLDARGGWHDAADLLKYLLTSGNTTAQMLLAYQLGTAQKNGAVDSDHYNALGQPGANGIPDLLDEARWGLDWMLKLHPAPDQLYHQVADDRDHTGWRLPLYPRAASAWRHSTPPRV